MSTITLYANPGVMQMATKNPRGRSRRTLTRPSQATGKSPSKRLIRRRRITARAPEGFFANPGKRGRLTRPSQATGKSPSKRLIRRRRITARAPEGFFANPRTGKIFRSLEQARSNKSKGSVIVWRDAGSGLSERQEFSVISAAKAKALPKPFYQSDWKILRGNPVKHGYTVHVGSTEIATFTTLMRAKQYGQALADNLGRTVSVQK